MDKKILKATHQGPLKITEELEIPSYVLEDGTRVLSQRGLQQSIGMSQSGGTTIGERRLVELVALFEAKGIKINELMVRLQNPIEFKPKSGRTAYGFEATLLPDFCDFILKCRDAGFLITTFQKNVAKQCDILIRAFAKIGIIALVDEATGYQEIRDKLALQKILEAYISQDLMKWQKRFYDDYYIQLFKLRGWEWKGRQFNPPSFVGKLTNDIIYDRLAPGVLEELKRKNPPDEETGQRKHKHHQWLTPTVGHPALDRHLNGVIALMKAASNWGKFKRSLVRAFPKPGEQTELDFD